MFDGESFTLAGRSAPSYLWGAPLAPYQYAADILILPTREERRAALAAVPEHLRALVREQVESEAWLLKSWVTRIRERGRNPDEVPAAVREALAQIGAQPWERK
jgi:hypothetical protein